MYDNMASPISKLRGNLQFVAAGVSRCLYLATKFATPRKLATRAVGTPGEVCDV